MVPNFLTGESNSFVDFIVLLFGEKLLSKRYTDCTKTMNPVGTKQLSIFTAMRVNQFFSRWEQNKLSRAWNRV